MSHTHLLQREESIGPGSRYPYSTTHTSGYRSLRHLQPVGSSLIPPGSHLGVKYVHSGTLSHREAVGKISPVKTECLDVLRFALLSNFAASFLFTTSVHIRLIKGQCQSLSFHHRGLDQYLHMPFIQSYTVIAPLHIMRRCVV